jgi:hypothetical protein
MMAWTVAEPCTKRQAREPEIIAHFACAKYGIISQFWQCNTHIDRSWGHLVLEKDEIWFRDNVNFWGSFFWEAMDALSLMDCDIFFSEDEFNICSQGLTKYTTKKWCDKQRQLVDMIYYSCARDKHHQSYEHHWENCRLMQFFHNEIAARCTWDCVAWTRCKACLTLGLSRWTARNWFPHALC